MKKISILISLLVLVTPLYAKSFSPKRISLVYISPEASTIAGLFGDIFLKVDGRNKESLAISFKANEARSEINILSKDGQFIIDSYLNTINSFSKIEDRSVWEYELVIAPENLKSFINSVNKIREKKFSTSSLNKNKTYHMISLLEELGIKDLPGFSPLPMDVVKAINEQEDKIKTIMYRPSFKKRILEEEKKLSKNELEEFNTIIRTGDYSRTNQKLGSLVMNYNEYMSRKDSTENYKLKNKKMNAAGFNTSYNKNVAIEKNRPDSGHSSSKFTVDQGIRRTENYYGFRYKFALNELADFNKGYHENSTLNLFDLKARYWKEQSRIELERLALIDIMILNPTTRFDKDFSWRFSTGVSKVPYLCVDCIGANIKGGYGLTSIILTDSLAYAMVNLNLDVNDKLEDNYRIGPILELGLKLNYSDTVNHLFKLEQSYYFNQGTTFKRDTIISTNLNYSFFNNFIISANYSYRFAVDTTEQNLSDIGIAFSLHF